MLSSVTQSRLAALIGAVAENERQIEVRRQLLAEQPLFAPYAAFKRVDRLHTGYLTPYDIKDFLRENGFVVTSEEASQLVELFTGKGPLRLDYEGFLTIVLPSDSLLRARAAQREAYPDIPPQSVEYALARVFQAEIDGINRLTTYWSDLISRYDYNVFDAFRIVDRERSGYVSPTNLYLFLKYADYPSKVDDSDLFIRRLDTDKDGQLSYSEFVDGLVPDFAKKLERKPAATSAAYYESYSEKKPSYYRRVESPAPRTEYKPRYAGRLGSAERSYSKRYESPARSDIAYSPSYTKPVYSSPYSKSAYQSTLAGSTYVPKKAEYVSSAISSPSKKRQAAASLAVALEEQIAQERRFERARQELVLQTDFNLMDGFRLFDYIGKGFVTLTEFCDGLRDLGIVASFSDISLLFKRYDRDSDGRLRYSDFCTLMTPKLPEYEKMLVSRAPYHLHHLPPKETYFTAKTRVLLREALETALNHEHQLENIRQRLSGSISFNAYDAFDSLDIQGKGQISLSSVYTAYYNWIS